MKYRNFSTFNLALITIFVHLLRNIFSIIFSILRLNVEFPVVLIHTLRVKGVETGHP